MPCDHCMMNSALTFKWFNLLTRIRIPHVGLTLWGKELRMEIIASVCFFQCMCVYVFDFTEEKSTLLIRKLCSFCFPNQSTGGTLAHRLGQSYLTESQG